MRLEYSPRWDCRRQAVVALFIIEAAVLGLVGGLLGSACGVLLAKSLMSTPQSHRIRSLCVCRRDGGTAIRFPIRSLDQPISLWLGGGRRWEQASRSLERSFLVGMLEARRLREPLHQAIMSRVEWCDRFARVDWSSLDIVSRRSALCRAPYGNCRCSAIGRRCVCCWDCRR